MSTAVTTISAADARRLLLQGQGLLHDPARKATPASVRKTIEHMGYVQVDTINSIERAHHHILMTRLDGYQPRMLTKLLEKDRSLFEHWTHDAAVLPTTWMKYWHHPFKRFEARARANDWWQGRIGPNAEQMVADVLQRIRDEGPLMSKDFEHKRGSSSPWWGWKPQKAALEYLWFSGKLAVSGRHNFHKRYELFERVFPNFGENSEVTAEETIDWAGKAALQRMGTGTSAEIREFFNAFSLKQVRQWCVDAAARGEIEEVTVETADGSKPRAQYAALDWRKKVKRAPEAPARMRLLSPFDPVIRDRKRLLRLFNFDYRFEAFVPEKKRKYGYYVLPLLEGDRLVGRCDPKFHRDEGTLKVRKLWWEPGVKATKGRRAMLKKAVHRLATQIGAERWTLPRMK